MVHCVYCQPNHIHKLICLRLELGIVGKYFLHLSTNS